MTLRIEMTMPAMPVGGMESVVARLTHALLRRGHDVGITCTERIGLLGERLRAEGMPVTVVPTLGIRTLLFPDALTDWLRRRKPDVVHTHSGSWPKCAHAAARAGVPRILHTEHGLNDHEPWYNHLLKRWAAHYTSVVIPVSTPLADYLHQHARIPRSRLHVVPNGIDTSVYTPGRHSGVVRSAFGIGPERVVIGHVARFTPVKNQTLLIDAFARLHARLPEAFLAFIGDGDLRTGLEQRARELGVSEHVGFFGYANDLPPVYRDFDLFALPSLAEGTSMSILEAMSSGIAVVATDVGGNTDLLEGGAAGRLVPVNDVPALTDALAALVSDTSARRTLGAAGRARAVALYEEERVVDRYEDIYYGRPLARQAPAAAPRTEQLACVESPADSR